MPETRLLKWEDANIKLQKSLIEAQRAKDRAEKEAAKLAAAAAASASTSHDGSSSSLPKSLSSARASGSHAAKDGSNAASGLNSAGAARGTKRGRDSLAFDEDEYKSKPEIKIVIPDLLKVKLVDDWEAITKNYQVRLKSSCRTHIALSLSGRFAYRDACTLDGAGIIGVFRGIRP